MLLLIGCGRSTEEPPGTSDEMWSESKTGEVLEVYVEDGRVYTAEYKYEIPELQGYDELEEGKHYKLTADVTYLNGGVAGYVDYPQIDRVISIEEIPSEESSGDTRLLLSINGEDVEVAWENNQAVEDLITLAKNQPYEIKLSKYSDFEQVGPIGDNLSSDDEQMTTEPGDIVLYSGDQLVIFYGSNTWAYTKLGHIEDKSAEELTELLGNDDVTTKLSVR